MEARGRIVGQIAAGALFVASSSRAQPNLPPPPPPPLGGERSVPALPPPPPPPPEPPSAPGSTESRPPPPATRRPPPTPPRRRRVEVRAEPAAPPPEPAHSVAVTWNPLGVFLGRLSANVEWELAPHHSLVVSPNALIFQADRGSRHYFSSEGLGFASPSSFGFGAEVGYHYWLHGSRLLRGWFLGPSVLAGATTQATVGDPTRLQGYWGLAADLGAQEVLGGGFTAGAGAGLAFLRMADASAIVPRFLLQLGWTF